MSAIQSLLHPPDVEPAPLNFTFATCEGSCHSAERGLPIWTGDLREGLCPACRAWDVCDQCGQPHVLGRLLPIYGRRLCLTCRTEATANQMESEWTPEDGCDTCESREHTTCEPWQMGRLAE